MKKRKSETPERDNPNILFVAAKGFYEAGLSCAQRVQPSSPDLSFQYMAPAAVNLSFACELILKGIILVSQKISVKGHDLKKLFLQLEAELREEVNERYNGRKQTDSSNADLQSFVFRASNSKDESGTPNVTPNENLEAFLDSHDFSFENWRYLHEFGPNGYELQIDFRSLDCFFKALIETFNMLSQRKAGRIFG
jgi:hypothetical protein